MENYEGKTKEELFKLASIFEHVIQREKENLAVKEREIKQSRDKILNSENELRAITNAIGFLVGDDWLK